eukprot:8268639-Heterocapsa_arctica.AAC.1
MLAGAVPRHAPRHLPTLAFLPQGVSFRLITTLPPSTARPAVLPVLEPTPTGRLPPEPGAASFGA